MKPGVGEPKLLIHAVTRQNCKDIMKVSFPAPAGLQTVPFYLTGKDDLT